MTLTINMKNLFYSFTILIMGIFASCEKNNFKSAKLLRDCTGTYLRINAKDYFVCNPKKVSSFADQSEIKVAFTLKSHCTDGLFHCEMLRPFDGYLTVDKVK